MMDTGISKLIVITGLSLFVNMLADLFDGQLLFD